MAVPGRIRDRPVHRFRRARVRRCSSSPSPGCAWPSSTGCWLAGGRCRTGWVCLRQPRWCCWPVMGVSTIVLEVAVITLPVAFLAAAARGQPRPTVSIAGTLLGVYWIGFALSHAVLLRGLPHGKGVLIDVLLGTFLGDTGRLHRRAAVRPPAAGPPDLAPQDLGGAVLRHADGDRRGVPGRPSSRAPGSPRAEH